MKSNIHNRPPNAADTAAFTNRIRKNFRHFKKRARTWGTDAFRFYDRDVPRYPLRLEYYAGILAVSVFTPDYLKGEKEQRQLTADLEELLADTLPVSKSAVYVRFRQKQKRLEGIQYQAASAAGAAGGVSAGGAGGPDGGGMDHSLEVVEGTARFIIRPGRYLDTGLFLDHRPLRLRVGAEAQAKKVLNLFCYTGAFSVHAALGGAEVVTSVDTNSSYLAWCRDNLQLNKIEEGRSPILRADISHGLPELSGGPFDIIVCDPPTFSKSKGRRDFDIQRDHVELLIGCRENLASGGRVYFSNNFMKFRLEERELAKHFLKVKEITASTIPEDCRREFTHRAWLLE